MNLGALPELLLSWMKTQGTALLQAGKVEPSTGFQPGAQYEGKVLDQIPGGRHLVQVAGQKLDMGLPDNTRPGDTVRLTFLSSGPRPTFLLTPVTQAAPVSSSPVQLSAGAQQVSTLMKLQPAVSAALAPSTAVSSALPSAPATSSATGAVNTVPQTAATLPPSRLATATLLLPGQAAQLPAAPLPAAQSVATAAGANGANQARPIVANVVMLQTYTAATALPTTAVASPNTALIGQAVEGLRAAVPASTTLAPSVVVDTASPSRDLLPVRLAQTLRESGLFYEAHLARWTKSAYPFESLLNEPQARLGRALAPGVSLAELGGMPEEAARMAGRQLQMLDGAPFLWQGFAWPGQWMDWLVEERQSWQEEGQNEAPADQWNTELRLTLPQMGEVHAQLTLRGGAVALRLTAADAHTAAAMQQALPNLQNSLEAAGLQPNHLTVAQGAE